MAQAGTDRAAHHALVLGVAGLLGHVVFDEFVAGVGEVTGVLRRQREEVAWWPPFQHLGSGVQLVDDLDVADWSRLERLLDETRPDTIVNCVGVTLRRRRSSDPVEMTRINALLPHLLAEWAANAGCRLITVSTDCVFGHEPGGFTETDPTTAADLYGRSKALGEVDQGDAVTVRTSFVGRELVTRTELLEWFLSSAGGTVPGYTDVWYSGVPVGTVASVLLSLATTHRHICGVHHLAAPEPISKFDLLRHANEAFDAGVTLVPDGDVSSHRTLDGSRLRRLLPIEPFDWEQAFVALAADERYDRRPDASVTAGGPGRARFDPAPVGQVRSDVATGG